MAKRNVKLGLLFLVLMAVVSLGSFVMPVDAGQGAGVWEEVCCGSACGTDYCIGDGTYTCCKGASTIENGF